MGWIGVAGWGGGLVLAGVALTTLGLLWRQKRRDAARCQSERLLRLELETYARMDVELERAGAERELAVRVCRMMVCKSRWTRAALLLADEGQLRVTGSAGFDDVALSAMTAWCAASAGEELARWENERGFAVTLQPCHEAGMMEIEDVRACRVQVVPLKGMGGCIVGALAVSVEQDQELNGEDMALEVLALRLACSVESRWVLDQMAVAQKQ